MCIYILCNAQWRLSWAWFTVAAVWLVCLPVAAKPVQVLADVCGEETTATVLAAWLAADVSAGEIITSIEADTRDLRDRAIKLREDKQYDLAEGIVRQALRADLGVSHSDELAIVQDLLMLGQLSRWRSKYSIAWSANSCAIAAARRFPENLKFLVARSITEFGNYEMVFEKQFHIDNARRYYTEAINILRPLGASSRAELSAPLSGLANILSMEGKFGEAYQLYEEALDIAEADSVCQSDSTCINVAICLDNLARVLINIYNVTQESGNLQQPEKLLNKALQIKLKRRGPSHDTTATTYQSLARLSVIRGNSVALALDYYRSASAILVAIGHQSDLSNSHVLSRLAEVSAEFANYCETLGTPEGRAEAILQYTISVDARQQMRRGTQGLPENYKRALDDAVKEPYYRLASLLINAEELAEAERVISLLKEEELSEILRGRPRTVITPLRADNANLDEQNRLSERLLTSNVALYELERQVTGPMTADQVKRHEELLLDQQRARETLQLFLVDLARRYAAPDRRVDTQAAKDKATKLSNKVALDRDGAIGLQYIVTSDRIAILVSTARGAVPVYSDVPRAVLSEKVRALREAITDIKKPANAVDEPARALWNILIKPVQGHIVASKATTIVLSLTGDLRYLPFAALQGPDGSYLIDKYAIAVWAGTAEIQATPLNRSWNVAAMGLTQKRPPFPALSSVESELKGIVRTEKTPGGIWEGSISLDEEFDTNRLDQALHSNANVLHIASHFDYEPSDEGKSVLLMGKEGETLSLPSLAARDFRNIQLLTLSACETTMGGKKNRNGAEVEGLAAAVLDAQAQSVLATLWKVVDNTTAELMKHFYFEIRGSLVTKARALQTAQKLMLHSASSAAESKTNVHTISVTGGKKQFGVTSWSSSHPRYWAPFVLAGNWL